MSSKKELKEPDSDDEAMEFLKETSIKTFPNLLHYMLNHTVDELDKLDCKIRTQLSDIEDSCMEKINDVNGEVAK